MLMLLLLLCSATAAEMLISDNLLYLGTKTVQLPSFTPLNTCSPPPHPELYGWNFDEYFPVYLPDVQELRFAVTGLVRGRVITCGGKYCLTHLYMLLLQTCLVCKHTNRSETVVNPVILG